MTKTMPKITTEPALIAMRHRSFPFDFPAQVEPTWSTRVDRWYQLDAAAFGLAQAYSSWKPEVGPPPSGIVLASPCASNETDRQFALGGGTSPSKFVHTLPNIRASSLCQVMDWTGPILCLQSDPDTLVLSLREAYELCRTDWPRVWVLGYFREQSGPVVHGFFLSRSPDESDQFRVSRPAATTATTSGSFSPRAQDQEFLDWLAHPSLNFILPSGLEVQVAPDGKNGKLN